MANQVSILLSFYSVLILSIAIIFHVSADIDRKVYIVYMGSLPKQEYSPSSHHLSLLQEVLETGNVENLLVRSYKRSFNAFAAKLSDTEAQKLAGMEGVVSVFPSTTFELHTTRSWSFIGLDDSADRKPDIESNVIVGVLDSGIWPESDSFNDTGFGPPPKKWRGSCMGGQNFTCNNKIIGARYYKSVGVSARDDVGHGTHTASTAAGSKVKDASFFGIAQGTARGGVPSARIAAYKVCGAIGCVSEDILAGFDDAIADGVDIITISLGGRRASEYYEDPVAIGAFHAMEKGIFVSQSAGNSGPKEGTVMSVAPWIISVAASSMDRRIVDKVVLGNGQTLNGTSVNTFSLKGANFPLIFSRFASSTNCSKEPYRAGFCEAGCLNRTLVKGKIVICERSLVSDFETVGAAGNILPGTDVPDNVSFVSSSPSLYLDYDNFGALQSYMQSTKLPTGNILKSEAINDSWAPAVAMFSSRGPNIITVDILKPDISAPGVEILAAFPTNLSPTASFYDKRRVKFNILSGTSMSCPHVAGAAAYVKTFHPDWSPSAIKSALMTTASNISARYDPEMHYGSGHLNPLAAVNPGLIYDAHKDDYINFLCSIKRYTEKMVRLISGENTICPDKKSLPRDLNYPSITAFVEPGKRFTISINRTVTNVGFANSTYKATIRASPMVKITVVPEVLSFKSVGEKKNFTVTAVDSRFDFTRISSSSLVWSDGVHVVRSPIVIHSYLTLNDPPKSSE
ncbi:subtilisin-like protease SBT4.9 [Mercurialis annua]|uniref:subtilisin-like protease SBT4.9 n=1 Tax=Mercurialis annua TaxID=3986 RepID=UPI0021608E27|nr:subtilisin-like protease SBT4.9 [Mercurialis annua]